MKKTEGGKSRDTVPLSKKKVSTKVTLCDPLVILGRKKIVV
jgi:hypothetical protein